MIENREFQLGRRLDKIEALAEVLSNQNYGTPLAGKHLYEYARMIAHLAVEAREILDPEEEEVQNDKAGTE